MLADDHAVITEGLMLVLDGYPDIEVVGAAHGGLEASELYEATRPDVTLMDLSMPEVNGVEAISKIRAIESDAKVIALTGFIGAQLVADAITAGAQGYLLKSVGGDELVDAIRSVHAGRSILTSEALTFLAAVPSTQIGDDLTPRERDVLAEVTRGSSNKQIARSLGLSAGTVRIYVSNVLSKLQVENRTAAAYVARQHSLVDDG
jgi:DNA-binding NarL/FixJ family response regulator